MVINPVAGNGFASKLYSEYFKFLKDHHRDFFPYHTTGVNDTENLQKLILHRSFDAISILGGDGTINSVVNAMGNQEIPLHIIPCGNGNDLIANLGKKSNQRDYFKVLLGGNSKEIDVFQCNGRRFACCFGIGFDGRVSELIEQNRRKSIPKGMVYWYAILNTIFGYKEIEIEINKERKEVFLLSLANNDRFGGGFMIAPNADLNDGLLDMVLITKISVKDRIKNLLKLKNGKHLGLEMVEHSLLNECRIYSKKSLPAHVDGELLYNHNYIIQYDRKIRILV